MAAVLDFYGVTYRIHTAGWVSALCCFHDESKASLRINVDNGGFLCQACGAKGHDSIHFIMAKEQCGYSAAWEIAATVPGDRIDVRPTTIAGHPAPIGRGTYRPAYKRRRRR